MRSFALVALVAACGRAHFDAVPDTMGSAEHDEDGDGVPDAIDVCPHLAGSQLDSDGDGIGDDCDPEPTNPRQHLVLFATLQPSDQPLTMTNTAHWSQGADAIHFDGMGGTHLAASGVGYQSARVALGIDVTQVIGTGVQHQIALHVVTDEITTAHRFVELNEVSGLSRAEVTYFNGTVYQVDASQDLASGFHTGSVFLQATGTAGGSLVLDGGWLPSETYHVEDPAAAFAPGSGFQIDINNAVLDLRYVWLISW